MAEVREAVEVLDDADLVLHKIEIFEFFKVVQALQVLDLVEGEVEGDELGESFKALDVCDQIIVEVDLGEGWCKGRWYFNGLETILTEAEALSELISRHNMGSGEKW